MKIEKAYFAGGSFWDIQEIFDEMKGILFTRVGYAGGYTNNPSYREVCSGRTGHAQTVEVFFDSEIISYTALVLIFFQIHNPTTLNAQGPNKGTAFRSALFPIDAKQKRIAIQLKKYFDDRNEYGKPSTTHIYENTCFFEAESWNQKFWQKQKDNFKSLRKHH